MDQNFSTAADFGTPARVNLWRDRDFVRLWVGQTASQLGAQASQVTLPLIAVIALGAGAGELGVLRAVQQLPVLLFALFVGVWVDRWRARDMMVVADFGRTVALAAIPVAFLFAVLDLPLLWTVAFVVGVFTVCFDVAYQAALPRLVSRESLAGANSAMESSRSGARIGGPALGGAVVSLLTAPIAVVTGTVFFTLSFLAIRGIRQSDPEPQSVGRQVGTLRRIHAGLRLVAGDRYLRAVCLASGAFQLSFAALMTSYLLFLPRTLHLSGAGIGLVLAALGPGALVGSLVSARLPRRFGYGLVLMSAVVISDGVMLFVPGLHGSGAFTIALLMAINVVYGASSQLVDVGVVSVRQAVTPIAMQGRVAATLDFVGMGLNPVGSLAGGLLASQYGPRTALLVAAVALWLSPLCLAVSPLSRLGKTLPPTNARIDDRLSG